MGVGNGKKFMKQAPVVGNLHVLRTGKLSYSEYTCTVGAPLTDRLHFRTTHVYFFSSFKN